MYNKTAAQTTVAGHIQASNGSAIPAATIKLKKSMVGAVSDSVGNYKLNIRFNDQCWVFCSAIGYQTDSLLIVPTGQKQRLDFTLKDAQNELASVTVSFRRNRIDDVKREYALSDLDVVTTPGAVADVAASLRTMPGAAPAGNETGLFVHGGSATETKAFFDGMLVKNPFGSNLPDLSNRSRFSAFMFKETAFSTSGYSAQYGDAMSSALSLETKEPTNKTSNEFSITSLGGGAAHTQGFKNSSLLVGANYYNFGLNDAVVTQNTKWQNDPKQYQATINYKDKVSPNGTLKIFADYSSTSLSFNILNPNLPAPDLFANTNNNLYFNTNYQGYLGNSWKVYAGLAYNYTLEKGNINVTPYNQVDKVAQEKLSFSRYINRGTIITLGAEQFQNARNESYDTLGRGYTDVVSAGFAEAEVPVAKRWVFKAGFRAEYSAYMNKAAMAPRISLAWYINKKNQLVFNGGVYYQKPDDSFLAQTSDLNFERAINYNIDYEFKSKGRSLRLQPYYKRYNDLVKIRTPVFSGFQAYGPPINITGFNNFGSGYAKGFDVFWRDSQGIPGLEYYVSYSYIDTKRNYIDYKAMVRPPFAPASTLNAVIKKFIMDFKGQISLTYSYSSGRPYFNPNNPVFMGDETKSNQNISVGFSYLPSWFHQFSVISISLSNIVGFNQVYGYRYAYDGTRRESILPPSRRGILVSYLMNIGDGWFNH
jgi:hypothetical protein